MSVIHLAKIVCMNVIFYVLVYNSFGLRGLSLFKVSRRMEYLSTSKALVPQIAKSERDLRDHLVQTPYFIKAFYIIFGTS